MLVYPRPSHEPAVARGQSALYAMPTIAHHRSRKSSSRSCGVWPLRSCCRPQRRPRGIAAIRSRGCRLFDSPRFVVPERAESEAADVPRPWGKASGAVGWRYAAGLFDETKTAENRCGGGDGTVRCSRADPAFLGGLSHDTQPATAARARKRATSKNASERVAVHPGQPRAGAWRSDQPTRPVAIDSEARRLGHRVRSVPGVGRLHARRIS